MGEAFNAKVFKSGNSVALRLPKRMGLKEGDVMRVREERGSFIIEPAVTPDQKIDLTGIYGSIPGLRPLTPNQRLMEPRMPELAGKPLDHG